MRKITTIASALMLGVFGFVANAQNPDSSTATVTVTPEPGPVIGWYSLPSQVTVNWENNVLAFVNGGSSLSLPISVDGKATTTNATAEISADGYYLTITPPDYSWPVDANSQSVSVTIPAKTLYIGAGNTNEYVNKELPIEYTIMAGEDGFYAVPENASYQFSVSSFVVGWEGVTLQVNPEYEGAMPQYGLLGEFDMETFTYPLVDPQSVKSVKANADGTLTVTLQKAFSTEGQLQVQFPAGYFMLTDANGSAVYDSKLTVNYYITPYQVAPNKVTKIGAFSPITSLYVYVNTGSTIETALFPELVEVTYNGKSYPVSTINPTTYNGYPALQYVLKNPIYYVEGADPQEVSVWIPESGVKINGKTIYTDIEWSFYIYPNATITGYSTINNPVYANNITYLYDLAGVELTYGTYTFTKNSSVTPYVTTPTGVQVPLTSKDIVEITTKTSSDAATGMGGTYSVLNVEFANPYTAPGVYTVTFPEGYLNVAVDANGGTLGSTELTAQFTVIGPMNYEIVPTPGDVQFFEDFVITFDSTTAAIDDDYSVTLINNNTGALYYGYLTEDNAPSFTFALTTVNPEKWPEEGTPAFVTIDDAIQNVGDYTLTMNGFYEVETINKVKYNFAQNEITAEYMLMPTGYITTNPEALSTLPYIDEIVVNLYEEGAEINEAECHDNPITLVNNVTGETWYCYYPYTAVPRDGSYASYTLAFTDAGGALTSVIDQVGVYALTIKNLYSADGNALPDQVLYYNVIPEGFVTFNPATDTTVEELGQVVVTFSQKVSIDDSVRPVPVMLENISNGDVWYCPNPLLNTKYEGEGTQYTLNFYEDLSGQTPVTVDVTGNYVLSVNGLYVVTNLTDVVNNGADEVHADLPAVTANYHLVSAADYLLTPASGETVDNLNNITIAYVDAVEFIDDYMPANAMLENRTTGDVYFCYAPTALAANKVPTGYKVAYTFSWTDINGKEVQYMEQAGYYHLTIMGTMYNGQELPYITADYMVSPDFESLYVFSPEGGAVPQLETVTLTVVGQPNIGIYDMRPAPVVLENVETGTTYYCESPLKTRGEDGSSIFTIYFTELNSVNEVIVFEPGEWTLTVRGLYYSVLNADETQTDFDLAPVSVTYYVVNETTGIESILGADSYDVYSVNGMQMIKNGKASDVNSLNPGLYIINGKKVIVRK